MQIPRGVSISRKTGSVSQGQDLWGTTAFSVAVHQSGLVSQNGVKLTKNKENALPFLTEKSMRFRLDPGAPMTPLRFSLPVFQVWFLCVCCFTHGGRGKGYAS